MVGRDSREFLSLNAEGMAAATPMSVSLPTFPPVNEVGTHGVRAFSLRLFWDEKNFDDLKARYYCAQTHGWSPWQLAMTFFKLALPTELHVVQSHKVARNKTHSCRAFEVRHCMLAKRSCFDTSRVFR